MELALTVSGSFGGGVVRLLLEQIWQIGPEYEHHIKSYYRLRGQSPPTMDIPRLGETGPRKKEGSKQSAASERTYSELMLIKSYLHSTMSQVRFNGLAILSIECAVDTTEIFSKVVKTALS